MANVFHTRRRVEFADTDMAGIVHFSNFFRWMESAEVDFLQARGLSVKMEWEGHQFGFPRVAASCEYLKPARFLDVIDIDVTLERLGTKSATYVFDFSRAGVPLARGKVTAVCCKVLPDRSFVSVEIPATMRERFV